jgi:Gamma tubulin complex component C-terminal/Gamma tubulin complex component N-terminal
MAPPSTPDISALCPENASLLSAASSVLSDASAHPPAPISLGTALANLSACGLTNAARRLDDLAGLDAAADPIVRLLLACARVSPGQLEKARPAEPYKNAFSWRERGETGGLLPGSACHEAAKAAPRLFTASVPALNLRDSRCSWSDSDDEGDCIRGRDGDNSSDSDAHFDPDAESGLGENRYAVDCIGKSARAFLDKANLRAKLSVDDSIKGDSLDDDIVDTAPVLSYKIPPRRPHTDAAARAWLNAAENPHIPTPVYRPELLCVAPELRVAFRAVLDRHDARPHHRMAAQIVALLLGAPSSLVPDGCITTDPPKQAKLAHELLTSVPEGHRLHAYAVERARWLQTCYLDESGTIEEFPPGHDAIVRRAYFCGRIYKSLSLFVDAYESGDLGFVLQAAVTHISGLLRRYANKLLARLEQEHSPGAVPVTSWSLLIDAELLVDDLVLVERAVEEVEELTRGSASEVLNVLYRLACHDIADQVLYKLFLAAAMPYFRMIWAWAFSASSARDGLRREFFGTVLGKLVDGPEGLYPVGQAPRGSASPRDDGAFGCDIKQQSAAVFPSFLDRADAKLILRAGRARALLAQVLPKHKVHNIEPPPFDKYLADTISLDGLGELQHALDGYAARVEHDVCISTGGTSNCDEKFGERADAECAASERDDTESCNGDDTPAGPADVSPTRVFAFPDELRDSYKHKPSARQELAGFSPRAFGGTGDDGGQQDNSVNNISSPRLVDLPSFERGWMPLPLLVRRLAIDPVARVDALVQREVLDYFVRHVRVHEHLETVWKYVLLGAGDFADVLVERIDMASVTADANELFIMHQMARDEMSNTYVHASSASSGFALRQQTHLAECLQAALNMSGGDENPFCSRLSIDLPAKREVFSFDDSLDERADDTSDGKESHYASSRSLWKSKMQVGYQAEYPLSFIVSAEVMEGCSVFFNFFLRLRRSERCLRRLFMIFRRQSSLRQHSTHAHALLVDTHLCTRVWRFCWEAQHFVRIVGEYEATQVLRTSWSSLLEGDGSAKSRTIWGLRHAVHGFLADSTRRALLGARHVSIMRIIAGVLDEIVRVELVLLPASDPSLTHDRDAMNRFIRAVDEAADGLQRRARFLVDVLQKLLSSPAAGRGMSGSHAELADLLNRLNYNGFYADDAMK